MRFNIFSGSTDGNGLAAALTNPTTLSRRKGTVQQDYKVMWAGILYSDAEAAYLTATKNFKSALDCDELMVDILECKFEQHPRLGEAVRQRGGGLGEAVRQRGGVAFLERCEHSTNAHTARFQAYEGYGRESHFIRNLIAAYERREATQR